MGRPSEEQLLGLHSPLRETNVSFEPPPPPEWGSNETRATEWTGTPARGWRLGPRDLVALAAVTLAVGLAVRSGDGLPFRSSEPAAPAPAGNVVRTMLAPDLADLTRTSPQADPTTQSTAKSGGHNGKGKDDGGSSGPSGGNDDDPPAGGGGKDDQPLVEASIPGVGTVTVDEPELPSVPDEVDAPTLPKVPDTGALLSGTTTVSLPKPLP